MQILFIVSVESDKEFIELCAPISLNLSFN